MNSFCQECGAQVTAADAFCPSCGHSLSAGASPKKSDDDSIDVLFGPGQEDTELCGKIRHDGQGVGHCIVFTNRARLQELAGNNALELELSMRGYLSARQAAGWRYHILDAAYNRFADVSGATWQTHVELLRQAVEHFENRSGARAGAVMIVGDETVIPMPCFDNPLYDEMGGFPDVDVDSDLPYSAMSVDDPFLSAGALQPALPVARIPTGGRDRGEVGRAYFSRDPMAGQDGLGSMASYGLSAEVWQGASSAVAAVAGIDSLHVCPDHCLLPPLSDAAGSSRYLYFNVHGSDEAREWFGESLGGFDYPVATEPVILGGISSPNAVATEACYGARFIGHTPEESALLSALASNAVAFSGSSRIAFGPMEPPVGLADIIAQKFLSVLKAGGSAGQAFLAARQEILVEDYLTPHHQLTVVEFNLFGDPTRSLPADARAATQAKAVGSSAIDQKGGPRLSGTDPLESIRERMENARLRTRVVIPDVLAGVNARIDATWQSIADRVSANVYESSPALKGVQPSIRELRVGRARSKVLQLGYGHKAGKFFMGRVVYADRQGKILKDIVSK